jgi:hypothetical protein
MNITVLCFSKDRPLQLQAYLESLMHYSGIPQSCITVLYKETAPILYDKLIADFPGVVWWKETDFRADLRKIVGGAREYILLGCDDVVYLEEWQPEHCMDMFVAHPEVVAVGLRIGRNVMDVGKWDCRLLEQWGLLDTWQQAWETGSSLYRKADVLNLLAVKPNQDFKIDYKPVTLQGDTIATAALTPNFLEAMGHRNQSAWLSDDRHHLACYPYSRAVAFSVNLVQSEFVNQWDGSKRTRPEQLHQEYLAGRRLNWKRLYRWRMNQVHVGAKEFVVE